MKFDWSSCAVGVIVGVGTILCVIFAAQLDIFVDTPICDQNETGLTCARNWVNAIAVIAGALVIAFTVRGQRNEANRHHETMRHARTTDYLRVQRLSVATDLLVHRHQALSSLIERAYKANYSNAFVVDITSWTRISGEAVETLLALDDPTVAEARPLFSPNLERSWRRIHQLSVGIRDRVREIEPDDFDVTNRPLVKVANVNRSFARRHFLDEAVALKDHIGKFIDHAEHLRRQYDWK